MAAMVTVVNATGTAAGRGPTGRRTARSAWTAGRRGRAGRTAGTRAGESRRKYTLQFGRLVRGQLAARHLVGNQGADLGLDVAGRIVGLTAAARAAAITTLQRRIDVGERRRQRTLVTRTDGARIHFGLQLGLQHLQRRLVIAVGGR